jgi:hypothetical protein
MTDDCRDWLDAQADEFMQPVAEYLDASEAREFTDDTTASAGWYSRLSAPGYLDCTDWSGPYETESEALEALYEMFGD